MNRFLNSTNNSLDFALSPKYAFNRKYTQIFQIPTSARKYFSISDDELDIEFGFKETYKKSYSGVASVFWFGSKRCLKGYFCENKLKSIKMYLNLFYDHNAN